MHLSRRIAIGGLAVALLAVAPAAQAATPEAPTATTSDGLAETPPLGWNSWNKFACDIDESLIRETADAMVSSGLKAAGYEYVNIDDCWMAPERDAGGRLQADPVRFPSGIKALADYVHAKGLKLGIYSSAGTKTCQGLPASLGHERVDAQSFADWEVDYLKYDNCNNQGVDAFTRYKAMGDALKATGRPIVYSLCEWGSYDPWEWGTAAGGHLWRTTGDINDSWGSVTSILDQQVGLESYSGPGAWNDPDMLEVGNGRMTDTEYRSHFSLWALLNAPLIAGNDLRSMSGATVSILTNPDVLAVNQDWGGVQGRKLRDHGDTEVWQKPMSDGSVAVVLFNRSRTAATISTTAKEIGLPAAGEYTVRDLWTHGESASAGRIAAQVPPHGVAMYRVRAAVARDVPPFMSVGLTPPTYLKGGQPVELDVTYGNLGPRTAWRPKLALHAPDGWRIEPVSGTAVKRIAAGGSHTARWRVTPTGDATGAQPLTASVTLSGPSGPVTTTARAETHLVTAPPSGTSYASDLAWITASNGWGPVERDTSNGESSAGDGRTITLGGVTYAKGLGVHASSSVLYYLGGGCQSFAAVVGVDDEVGDRGSVSFELWADGRKVADSGVMRGPDPGKPLSADLSGATELELKVTTAGDGPDYDHADWADAKLTCS